MVLVEDVGGGPGPLLDGLGEVGCLLGVAGGQGQVLADPVDRVRVGPPPGPQHHLGDRGVDGGFDVCGALGVGGDQRVRDSGEFAGGAAVAAGLPFAVVPGQAGAAGDLVGQQQVVGLGVGDRGLVQGGRVQGAPVPVRPLDPVGDRDV